MIKAVHYSQEIFEGLKTYLSEDERVLLFRPEENARRMNRSAKRLCMLEIPEELFLNELNELISLEKHWIPKAPGTSLYIRPAMIGVEPFLGVRSSKEYLFYIVLSPVGPYYKEGLSPVGSLFYKNNKYVIGNNNVSNVTQAIYDRLTAIQYGKIKDEFGWVREIDPE